MKKVFFCIVGCIMLCAFFTPLCKAASQKKVIPIESYAAIDSVMRQTLSDSITNIVLNADKVVVYTLHKDSLGNSSIKCTQACNKEQVGVLKFALAASKYEKLQAVAFGIFNPYVKIKFHSKKQSCFLLFDFGLKQFKVYNAKNEELSTALLQDELIIKAIALVYPKDEFINFIIKQQ